MIILSVSRPLVAMLVIMIQAHLCTAQTVRFRGDVVDPSDNLINGAQVHLSRLNASWVTDDNGAFDIELPLPEDYQPSAGGVLDKLEIRHPDHLTRSMEIRSQDFFARKQRIVIQPVPIDPTIPGFKGRMDLNNATMTEYTEIHVHHELGRPRPGSYIEPEAFEAVFRKRQAERKEARMQQVRFHIYVPETTKRIKAAFFISRHGCGNIGHRVLRKFAHEHDVALIGVRGAAAQRGFYPVSTINPHVKRLAEMSGHPELVDVPYFTFGHSNGTGFATTMAAGRPEKALGWVSFHSGWSFYLQFPGLEKVPGMLMHGPRDKWFKHGQEEAMAHMRKHRNAPFNLTWEISEGHGPSNKDVTWSYIVEFCKAVMRVRLNQDGSVKPVDIESGWLGANYDKAKGGPQKLTIAPYHSFPGDKTVAHWLPDEEFARIWQEFCLRDARRENK